MPGPTPQQLYAQNMRRETWCRVEVSAGRSWERRHFGPLHPRTTRGPPGTTSGRSAWMERPTAAPLPERRHFDETPQTHLS
ncbi:hypothetical protein NHX12_026173 [Muraenolepis orangiensis]|uniref:Uncharacterized protein n=1 Tax=Muraenolepis orangiensis TaxID=630683 RepID=A0A9Q0EEM0_9TELE|nr:hypothetical protein NHX12_026173 [Muraenolepis orangiensis]